MVFTHLAAWSVFSGALNPLRFDLRVGEPDRLGPARVQRLVDAMFLSGGLALLTLALDYGASSHSEEIPFLRLSIALTIETVFLALATFLVVRHVRRVQLSFPP